MSFRASTAVRSRRRAILLDMQAHAARTSGQWLAMSIASGSSWELRDVIHESFLVTRAEFRCLDQDPEALAAAEAGYRAAVDKYGRSMPVEFVSQRVKDMLQTGLRQHPTQDYIYSLGLFDYLPEAAGAALIQAKYSRLKPGGRLIAGNYAHDFDARCAIELVMDWKLIARTKSEMMALSRGLPDDAKVDLQIDSTQSLWMLSAEKPL